MTLRNFIKRYPFLVNIYHSVKSSCIYNFTTDPFQELYCPYLENSVHFNGGIHLCSPGSKYIRPCIPYSGGPFPLEEFIKLREKTLEGIKGGSSECLNCPSLIRGIKRKNKFLISSITFEHSQYCNGKCTYCDVWMRGKVPEKYQVYDTLKWLIDNGYVDVNGDSGWGGGEPTLLPEFGKIISLLDKVKMHTMVNTNAILFSETLAESMNHGHATIQVSLDAGDSQSYIDMKGQDKFYDVVNNIRKYAFINPDKIKLKYIINDKNNSDESIRGFLNLCSLFGIKDVNLSPEAKESWDHGITDKTFDGIKLFLDISKKRGFVVTIFWDLFGKEYSDRIRTFL